MFELKAGNFWSWVKAKTGARLRKGEGEELHGFVGESEPGAVEIAAILLSASSFFSLMYGLL